MVWILGLTGGIGSGKSTVARGLVNLGAALVDTDAIAHELTAAPGIGIGNIASQGAAMPALVAEFGLKAQKQDGSLDRDYIRNLVFNEPTAKARLEAILHPLIRDTALARCTAYAAAEPAPPYVVLDIPLLAESTQRPGGGLWRTYCQRILVVDCPVETQIARVMQRNHWTQTQVEQVIAAQASREQRLAVADDVLVNDCPLPEVLAQLETLHFHYAHFAANAKLAEQ